MNSSSSISTTMVSELYIRNYFPDCGSYTCEIKLNDQRSAKVELKIEMMNILLKEIPSEKITGIKIIQKITDFKTDKTQAEKVLNYVFSDACRKLGGSSAAKSRSNVNQTMNSNNTPKAKETEKKEEEEFLV